MDKYLRYYNNLSVRLNDLQMSNASEVFWQFVRCPEMGSPVASEGMHVFNDMGDAYPVSAKVNLLGQCPTSGPVSLVTDFYKHLQVTRSMPSPLTPMADPCNNAHPDR
jgi:hypothetical protein